MFGGGLMAVVNDAPLAKMGKPFVHVVIGDHLAGPGLDLEGFDDLFHALYARMKLQGAQVAKIVPNRPVQGDDTILDRNSDIARVDPAIATDLFPDGLFLSVHPCSFSVLLILPVFQGQIAMEIRV